jgi:hypothetical protein
MVAAIDIYVFGHSDPMLGPGITFHISVWLALGAWLLSAFGFAAGAHRFRTQGSPGRSALLGGVFTGVYLLVGHGIDRIFNELPDAIRWLLIAMFFGGSFLMAKFAGPREVVTSSTVV